jgi:hypothetical protein
VRNDEDVIESKMSSASFGKRERCLEVAGRAHLERLGRQPQLPGCSLGLFPECGMAWGHRIPDHGDSSKPRHQLLEELHALAGELIIEKSSVP